MVVNVKKTYLLGKEEISIFWPKSDKNPWKENFCYELTESGQTDSVQCYSVQLVCLNDAWQ